MSRTAPAYSFTVFGSGGSSRGWIAAACFLFLKKGKTEQRIRRQTV
ncbi:MAG: hypothetical protein PHI87_01745 [Candidatus Methanomethylophilus sp.]|nr:hypothetical protein [Methanomethylophilus sp.]